MEAPTVEDAIERVLALVAERDEAKHTEGDQRQLRKVIGYYLGEGTSHGWLTMSPWRQKAHGLVLQAIAELCAKGGALNKMPFNRSRLRDAMAEQDAGGYREPALQGFSKPRRNR